MKSALLALAVAGQIYAQQSALHPAGPHANGIARLGGYFLVLLGAIFVIVIALALIPLLHGPSRWTERKLALSVGIATGVTVLILFGLVVISVSTGKEISGPQDRSNSLVVEITAQQWWWYVRYPNSDASKIVVTANEIHIPVGTPVMIRGTSTDVIHSFWVPNLQGKRDLIPSRVTTEWIEADHPGRFRGQCAEFCGLEHAHMALWVVAETPDRFGAWMAHQLQLSAPPSDPVKVRGQEVFLNNACILCHSIGGTRAAGQVGPDLTHLAGRLTLAAGTLPNNKGNLAGWIGDPQNIKPGNHMATVPLKGEDMEPLLEYLGSLQ